MALQLNGHGFGWTLGVGDGQGNSSNAGLGSMDDECLPIEDVVHLLELEESNAK